MHTQLTSVFETIQTELCRRRTDIAQHFGAAHLRQSASGPRLVWVATEETFEAPLARGNRASSSVGVLYTRIAGIDVHLWGATENDTEELCRLFIETCDRTLGEALSIRRGRWVEASGADSAGVEYVLSIAIKLLVTIASSTSTVTLTNWPMPATWSEPAPVSEEAEE